MLPEATTTSYQTLHESIAFETPNPDGNQITDAGASKLAAALLRGSKARKELNLRNNQITDDSAGWLAAALPGNTALKELKIWQIYDS